MFRKILFIGDSYRGNQAKNILRLQSLFSPVLKELGIPFSVLITETNWIEDDVSWLGSWKSSLDDDGDSGLDLASFYDAAVVGFEISKKDLSFLDENDISWMNISIHPIRFLDDLYLNVETSFSYDFSNHSASGGLIDLCVQALRSRYGFHRAEATPNSLGIFGQTAFDQSVYFDGDFRSLGDYLSGLDNLVAKHSRVLYRPHPYQNNPEVDDLIKNRYDAQICSQKDIYELLVSGGMNTACAISSSVLTEVPYFDIAAEALEPRAKKFGNPISYRALLDDQDLWRALLGETFAAGKVLHISRAVPIGYLRRVFSSWGFVTDQDLLKLQIEADVANRLRNEFIVDQEKTRELVGKILSYENSRSWRITAPLRWFGSLMRKK